MPPQKDDSALYLPRADAALFKAVLLSVPFPVHGKVVFLADSIQEFPDDFSGSSERVVRDYERRCVDAGIVPNSRMQLTYHDETGLFYAQNYYNQAVSDSGDIGEPSHIHSGPHTKSGSLDVLLAPHRVAEISVEIPNSGTHPQKKHSPFAVLQERLMGALERGGYEPVFGELYIDKGTFPMPGTAGFVGFSYRSQLPPLSHHFKGNGVTVDIGSGRENEKRTRILEWFRQLKEYPA